MKYNLLPQRPQNYPSACVTSPVEGQVLEYPDEFLRGS